MEQNNQIEYLTQMFNNYADIVNPKELKEMLGGNVGTNKIYQLLKNKEIYNKKVGNNYIILKLSVIEFLMRK